ncbi:MAG: hypothetical protein P9L98_04815 [Candidatus Kaelpia imicola]|nr:hypothetical protein [Candidatus Kaelpia imicola]
MKTNLLCIVISVFLSTGVFISVGESTSYSHEDKDPYSIMIDYLNLYAKVKNMSIYFFVEENSHTVKRGKSIAIGGASSESMKSFRNVCNDVCAEFRRVPAVGGEWLYFTFEGVVVSLDNAMRKRGYNVDSFYAALRSSFETNINRGRFAKRLDAVLGEGWESENNTSTLDIYRHIVREDGMSSVERDQNFLQSIYEYIIDWYISARLQDATDNDIMHIIERAQTEFIDDIYDGDNTGSGDKVLNYLGVTYYDSSKWSQVSTVLFFAELCETLGDESAEKLINSGHEDLVYEMEVLLGRNLFVREDNGYITTNEKISEENVVDWINMRMELVAKFRDVLNKYYGRSFNAPLSVADSIEAEVFNSAIDGVFWILRDNNYNPIIRRWEDKVSFDEAVAEQVRLYQVATEIRATIENAIGDKLASYDAQDRILLETIARRAIALERGGIESEAAVETLKDLFDFSSPDTKGSQLRDALLGFYQQYDSNKKPIDFSDNRERSAYLGFIDFVANVLSRPDYFGVTPRTLDGEDGAFQKALSIFTDAQAGDLAGKLCATYGAHKWYVSEGILSGVYAFWAQVASAKGMDVVQEQLDARKKIYEALKAEIGSRISVSSNDFKITLMFEEKLGGLTGQELIAKTNAIVASIGFLRVDLSNITGVYDSIDNPPADSLDEIYPRLPQIKGPIELSGLELSEDCYAIEPVAPFIGLEEDKQYCIYN